MCTCTKVEGRGQVVLWESVLYGTLGLKGHQVWLQVHLPAKPSYQSSLELLSLQNIFYLVFDSFFKLVVCVNTMCVDIYGGQKVSDPWVLVSHPTSVLRTKLELPLQPPTLNF